MLKKMLLPFLIFQVSFGLDISSLTQEQKDCYQKLVNEAQELLLENPNYIQAQVRLTSLKLAHKILKRKGLSSKSLDAYANSIIGAKTLERFDKDGDIKKRVLEIAKKYSKDQQSSILNLEKFQSISGIKDKDVAGLMLALEETWKGSDSFGFTDSDYAIAFFLDRVSSGDTLSSQVEELISEGTNENQILKGIKKANQSLKNMFAKLASSVHKKYASKCVVKQLDGKRTQIESIFSNAMCRKKIAPIIEQGFLDSLKRISFYTNLEQELKNQEKSFKGLLKEQDRLNGKTDLEKIIGFHKSFPTNKDCSGYVVVNKKEALIELYSNDGTNLLSSKGLMGDQARKDKKLFSPDSRLRRFSNGTYTRTTGAGIYYAKKDIDNRKARKYDEEFNDRVLALSFKDSKGQLHEEKILAIHGVPNMGWIGNRDRRLASLDDESLESKLTTGCVNITGVDYDIINEYMQNKCPVYILPEDSENFYHIKDNQLVFTTKNQKKLKGLDHSLKLVNGKQVEDDKNFNIVKYNNSLKGTNLKSIKTAHSLDVKAAFKDFIDGDKKDLLSHNEVMDLFSLKLILDLSNEEVPVEKLHSAIEKLKLKHDFSLGSTRERRLEILRTLKLEDKIVPDLIVSGSMEVEFE